MNTILLCISRIAYEMFRLSWSDISQQSNYATPIERADVQQLSKCDNGFTHETAFSLSTYKGW